MRSATTADIRDSIAPSMATVTAGEISVRTSDGWNAGTLNAGSPDGTPPKREATVSTGSWIVHAAAVPISMPTRVPGTALTNRLVAITRNSVATASPAAAGVTVPMCPATAAMRRMNSPGFSAICNPRKSRICVLAISTAMPLVKPITTGRGMNFTALPLFVTPSSRSMTPAIIVHM